MGQCIQTVGYNRTVSRANQVLSTKSINRKYIRQENCFHICNCDILKWLFKAFFLLWEIVMVIWLSASRTLCPSILSEVILPLRSRSILLITREITGRIGPHSVLPPLLIKSSTRMWQRNLVFSPTASHCSPEYFLIWLRHTGYGYVFLATQ